MTTRGDEFSFNDAPVAVVEAEEEKETGRIEAFSDGVFSIATTLLVLEIHVPALPLDDPGSTASKLLSELLAQAPHYLAYFLGFSTIVIMWMNHHSLFRLIRRSAHGLLIWNSLLLLVISVVPFFTALVADYLLPLEDEKARLVLGIYSAWGIVISICYNALWWYMSGNNRLINRTADPREVRAVTQSYFFGPLLYVVGMVAAIFDARISLVANLLLILFFALPTRVQGTLAARAKHKELE